MIGLHKFSLKNFSYLIATLAILSAITVKGEARCASFEDFYIALTDDTIPKNKNLPLPKNKVTNSISDLKDTVPVKSVTATDTIPAVPTDTLPTTQQTIDTFSFKMSKDTLDAPLNYEAEDSAVVLVEDKKFILYGNTKTTHKDITLTAPQVELNQQTSIVTAVNAKDSTGDVIARARFEQGENKFESDTIRFNLKTQKGLTRNTFTQQDEMFIQGRDIKKVDANTVFISEGRFTTCNLDEPHFDFRSKRMKFVNNKIAVTGYVQLAFEDVPVPKPIGLPFGMFPLTKGRHSGLLQPNFTVNEQYGLGLEGLGYYKVLNDNIDVTVRGNLYSYGGWIMSVTPTYRVRYRYNGSFNFDLQNTKLNFKGDPDFTKQRTFNISWQHSVDPKARPGSTFGARVNAGSTKYNQYVPNNPTRNFQNQLNSSIWYSKSWAGKPYNLTLSANHNQNNQSGLVSLILPEGGFTVTNIFPFQRKEFVGTPKWYEKIGVGYQGNFRNQVSFYDTEKVSFEHLLDTLQWGVQHRVPLSISLPPIAGNIFIAPSISYQENWMGQKVRRTWDTTSKTLLTNTSKGLYTDRQVTFGLGFNTAVYGTFQFKNSRLQAIRHVFRPNISFNYKPDLSRKHYYTVQVNEAGRTERFSELQGSLFSGFSEGRFGGISFGADNNLEMKLKRKKDTTSNEPPKIRLIDGFGFTSGYNFLSDSLKLQPFQLYLRSSLFEKINLTAQALLDPYEKDVLTGRTINRFVWQGNRFSPGRITSGSLTLSTDFRSKPRDPNKAPVERGLQGIAPDPTIMGDRGLLEDQQRLQDYMQRNPAEFVDFNIPWSINLSLTMYFNRRLKADFSDYETEFTSNLSFNNSFSLTPKWNFSTSGYFNVKQAKLESFQMSISREMHCWQMSISVTPIGPTRFFNITISPRSAILQNLRVNRTRSFFNY